MASPPLLVVTLVFRSKAAFGSLPHVIHSVSTFLDSSVELQLGEACKFGSLALLDRIFKSSVDLESETNALWSVRNLLREEKYYRQFMFTWSLVESIELGNLEMVRWVMDHFPDCNVSWEISMKIGGKGAIEIMRFLLESDPNSGEMVEEESDEEVESRKFRYGILNAAQAAYEGYGDLVRLMYEATGQFPRQNDITMASAVINGDIGLVQRLMTRLEMEPTKGMAETAAKGNIRMLQWMYEHGYGGEEDAGVLLRAAEEGHMDIVRWVIDRDWANEELDTDDEFDYYCDNWLGAHFIIREYCHITSIGEASLAIHAAAIKGQLEIAKYLRTRVDTPLDEMDKARRSRRVKNKLKELRVQLGEGHNGAEVSGKTMIKAAEKGFLDVVKWLFVEYGSNPKIDIFGFFDSAEQEYHSAIDAAAGDGHLEIVRYLH